MVPFGNEPEPDIDWPGLAADIDGVVTSRILGDQSGADHGEAARRQQPT